MNAIDSRTQTASGSAPAAAGAAALRMLVLGYPRFARRQMDVFSRRGWRSSFIESRFILHALTRVPFCDAVYQIGMPVVPAAIFDACGRYGKPIIKHWVGTDVLRAGEPEVARQNDAGRIEHWADAPWLAEELGTVGISAKFVGLSPVAEVPEMPLGPAPLTVLTFDGGVPVKYVYTTTIDRVTGGSPPGTQLWLNPSSDVPAPNQLELGSLDGGTTWAAISPPLQPGAIGYFDSAHWWWIGSAAWSRSADGGSTWTPVRNLGVIAPLPATLQLLDDQHAWYGAAAGDRAVLETTSDGGVHWRMVLLPG